MKNDQFYKQKGVTLLVSMIMLLILTMVGVSTSKDATIQERMASNNQQISLARTNAHSALVAAEEYLANLNIETEDQVVTEFAAVDGLYIPLVRLVSAANVTEPLDDMTKPSNWDDENSIVVDTGVSTARFFVEYIGLLNNETHSKTASLDDEDKNKTHFFPLIFRITAMGYGASGNASILQSIYSSQQGQL